MTVNYNTYLYLFGILTCFVLCTVGIEAIIGGEEASFNQFKYQVSIEIFGHGHGCGGALIGDKFVLTAASCVIKLDGNVGGKPIFVLVGTRDLEKTEPPAMTVQVAKIFLPIDYLPRLSSTTGDIAVLVLKSPLALVNHTVYRRARVQRFRNEGYDGKVAKIAGFGWSWIRLHGENLIGGRNNSHLRFAETEILSHEQCQHEHPTLTISENHLYAKVKQQSTDHSEASGVCIGDGGSPLVIDNTVIGIFSRGPKGCNETKVSAIYTRVSCYLTFIRNAKEDKNGNRALRLINLL